MSETQPQYRWARPYDWLSDKLTELANEGNLIGILAIAREFAAEASGDQIQDLFERDMDADRYFEVEETEEAEP